MSAPDSVRAPAKMQEALIALQIPSFLHPITKLFIATFTGFSNDCPSADSTAVIYVLASASRTGIKE